MLYGKTRLIQSCVKATESQAFDPHTPFMGFESDREALCIPCDSAPLIFNNDSLNSPKMTESPLGNRKHLSQHLHKVKDDNKFGYLKNILLINLSLLTGFLFLPLGISVHILAERYQRQYHVRKLPGTPP